MSTSKGKSEQSSFTDKRRDPLIPQPKKGKTPQKKKPPAAPQKSASGETLSEFLRNQKVCGACGGTEFWGPQHLCQRCHPDPETPPDKLPRVICTNSQFKAATIEEINEYIERRKP